MRVACVMLPFDSVCSARAIVADSTVNKFQAFRFVCKVSVVNTNRVMQFDLIVCDIIVVLAVFDDQSILS